MMQTTCFSSQQDQDFDSNCYSKHNSESLRRLWGEENGENVTRDEHDNEGDDDQMLIDDMIQRTGMQFASNPREFHSASGMPKHGFDLSDDDDRGYDHNDCCKPSLETEAYDPAFDYED